MACVFRVIMCCDLADLDHLWLPWFNFVGLCKSLPLSYSRYQRKNDKMASPKRAFNKKKNAEHKKAAVERFVDELE